MLSTVYSPLNKLRKKRSQRGASAASDVGRVIRNVICSGSSCSCECKAPLGFRRMPQIKSPKLFADDDASQRLVRQTVCREKMFIEKMSEGAVTDVVQQRRHAQQRFHISPARNVGTNFSQTFVERGDRLTRQMHGAHDMLKARVLGRGEDPERGL